MAIVGILVWWYSAGWLRAVLRVRDKLVGVYDYFSIDLLIRTLFSPFRQISAGKVDGPVGVQLRAFVDRLISRIIGSIVRTLTIVVGSLALLLVLLWGICKIVLWFAIPVAPIVGLVLMLTGWIPWQI